MSKRPHEDSVFAKTANFLERSASTPGNSISINELLSNSEEPEVDHSEAHARKPRNFIASVVYLPFQSIKVIDNLSNKIYRHAKTVA